MFNLTADSFPVFIPFDSRFTFTVCEAITVINLTLKPITGKEPRKIRYSREHYMFTATSRKTGLKVRSDSPAKLARLLAHQS